jgi:predicted phosphodiesterase
MRRILQIFLLKPILWVSSKFASKPQPEKINNALSNLRMQIENKKEKKGIILKLNPQEKYIVFSDQHRGAKNGADDFMNAEPNYLAALDYYFQNGYNFISLGDCEELWENTLFSVRKHNGISFESEKRFIQQNRFYKIFGNHDLFWVNDPLGWWFLSKIYGQEVKVYEGIVLEKSGVDSQESAVKTPDSGLQTNNSGLTIFLTHGHQGDASSDGNWFSKFFVARIWAPLQAYLKINPNTPAYDVELKTKHNKIMFEWSAQQKNLLLITGHTHQPIFESLTHPERLQRDLLKAKNENDNIKIKKLETALYETSNGKAYPITDFTNMKPSYFNSGCCCFNDGDITGIEITFQTISLVKWNNDKGREILEQTKFTELQDKLK